MHDTKSFENPPLPVKSIALPRRARLDSPGTLHHVIIRGIEKGPIVDDDDDRKAFVDRMGELSQVLQTPVYAWALMTNHAHILLRSGAAGLSSYMRKLLTFYAGFYNRRHRRHGHLFQNRYKSIIVQEDTYFKELVRYIHLNPLRAGMVDSLANLDRKKAASRMIQSCCKEADINGQALLGGSRNRPVSKVRRELSHKLTKELGLSYAETARQLGVSTSAVSRIITRSGVYK
jgi:REP element-mobilizing transposase RayT